MNLNKLDDIFDFLRKNRVFNKNLQQAFYTDVILSRKGTEAKVISLLYHIANTQSKPNIDNLASFFKTIHSNYSALSSFGEFVKLLKNDNVSSNFKYVDLFEGLAAQKGWGNKTAALFVKSIYHVHHKDYDKNLRIWSDVPQRIGVDEKFFLPVDSVIKYIFEFIGFQGLNDFTKINSFLHDSKKYPAELMEIWDDLWFWGFITQKGGGRKRHLTWNCNKYWGLLHSDKNPETIRVIEQRSNEFIGVLSA